MEDLLSGALLVLLVGGAVFAWADWRIRARNLPQIIGPSWDCPHCGVKNEAELGVCWSCGAGIGRYAFSRVHGAASETWQCRQCRAWNSTSRRSCWSCANTPSKQPKRDA
ncbi:MAG TPA: zinc finger protein [Thermoplasmata archaeon]|nr:zinc finger protein [Thermoplasmata archaeon]